MKAMSVLVTCKTTIHISNSQGVWLFGDRDKALSAAGFTPERMRLWAYWDHQKVIQQIQLLRKNNLPLYAQYAMRNHTKLFSAAGRQFGSWGRHCSQPV
jgi:hypothetical protein